MPDTDPGSLNRLHDIVVPAPVPWWPPAPGWYVVASVVLAILGLGVWWSIVRWRHNRYRREALRDLDRIARDPTGRSPISAIAELTKRVALAAYPRDRVASLTGDAWLAFLDATGGTDGFTRGAGQAFRDIAYRQERPREASEVAPLATVVRHWINHHRC